MRRLHGECCVFRACAFSKDLDPVDIYQLADTHRQVLMPRAFVACTCVDDMAMGEREQIPISVRGRRDIASYNSLYPKFGLWMRGCTAFETRSQCNIRDLVPALWQRSISTTIATVLLCDACGATCLSHFVLATQ